MTTAYLNKGVKTFQLYSGCLDLRETENSEEIKLDPRLKAIVDRHLFDFFYCDDYNRQKVDIEGLFWPHFDELEYDWYEELFGPYSSTSSVKEAIELSKLFGTLIAIDEFTAVPVYKSADEF